MRDRPFSGHLAMVVFWAGIALAYLIYVLTIGGTVHAPGSTNHKLHVLVPSAAALNAGDRVTIAGVRVGRVTGVKRNGFGSSVDMTIYDKRVWPIPTDSRVQIRQHTPVGENYVSITRGKATSDLADDAVIPSQQSDEYVDVDAVLSTLRGKTRQRARDTLQGLGKALDGNEDNLNQTVGEGAQFLHDGSQTAKVLDRDRVATGQLVENLGDVASAIGERGAAIDTIAKQGMTALTALRDRDQALAKTLDELPSTLTKLQGAAVSLRSTSLRAAPVVNDLSTAVRDVRPAVRDLRPATKDGTAVLTALNAATPGLRGTINQVTKLSGPLSKALPTVKSTFCQINPMLRYIEPYKYDAMSILIGLGSSSNSYDATGHLIRLAPIINDNSLGGLPDTALKASQTLVHSGLFGSQTALSYDPYPKPGQVGLMHATNNGAIGPSEVTSKNGYKYPHVEADC